MRFGPRVPVRGPASFRRSSSHSPCGLRWPALFLAGLGAVGAISSAQATELVRVNLPDKAARLAFARVAPESRDCGAVTTATGTEFPIERARRIALENAGWDVEVVVADLESLYSSQLFGGGLFGDFHTYTEAIADMDLLAEAHPAIMTGKFSIGQTIEGREVWAYKISDHPGVDEDEPEVFFNAYIHAREPITFEILLDLATLLVESYAGDPEIANLVDTREIFFVPVVNPDGVEYNASTNPAGGGMWRKNRRPNGGGNFGVDLNRNFSDHWGFDDGGSSGDPGSDTYRGTAPFSEPETQAMRDFVLGRDFSLIVNYHAWGRLELFAPEYQLVGIPDYDELLALGQLRASTSGYEAGSTWQALYPVNGGANDWMYSEGPGKPRILSILTEVGTAFWPPESSIPSLVAENRAGNMRFLEIADDPRRALAPAISEVVDPGPVGSGFLLEWTSPDDDPANPATSWNVIEATGADLLVDDVETGLPDRWQLDGWTSSTLRAHSGTRSLRAGFADEKNDVLLSTRGHTVRAGDVLRVWTWYQLETGYDYGYVEVATEAGDFVSLPGNITTNANPNNQNAGNGITGSSSTWVLATFDLSAYIGETIWIRFHCVTDGGVVQSGWFLDEIEPVHAFPAETVVASGIAENQLILTGRDDGDYAYLVQAIDPDGQLAPWSMPMPVTVLASASVPGVLADGWAGLRLKGENPVRERAVLSLSIPEGVQPGESVTLRVHDVQGRAMASALRGPVGGRLSASGGPDHARLSPIGSSGILRPGATLDVIWDAERVGAGVYFAALEVGHRMSRQRVVIIR